MALRCLIVDDNARYGEAVRALLERQGVAVVGVATTGEESAWLVRRFRPDVVLLDINLGKESGFDVARHVVPGHGRSTPRVILISTHDEREFLDLIEASPAIGFLSKADVSAAAIYRLLRDAEVGDVNERRET